METSALDSTNVNEAFQIAVKCNSYSLYRDLFEIEDKKTK